MNDINKILQSDFVDILFDQRNKEYGAYELRTKYGKRLAFSLLMVCSVIALVGAILVLSGIISARIAKKKEIEVKAVELANVQKERPKTAPPPPPPKLEPPKTATTKFTPPKIAKDSEVTEDDRPPILENIGNVGRANVKGVESDGVIEAPTDDLPSGPPEVEKEEEPLQKVEQEAEFPGGVKAWTRYIEREINKSMDDLSESGFSGTVIVQFIVNRKGEVSDVKALTNGHTKLAEIAVEAIKKGPKWVPGVQNGKSVPSYRKQPVTFRIEDGQ